MPSPAYIICSDAVSEDRSTNVVSLFNVIEKITVNVQEPAGETAPAVPKGDPQLSYSMVVLSVWVFQPDESGEYENEITVHSAEGEVRLRVKMPNLTVTAEPGMPFRRIRFSLQGFPPLNSAGIWYVTNRLRRPDGDWVSQSFPFYLEANDTFLKLASKQAPQEFVAIPG